MTGWLVFLLLAGATALGLRFAVRWGRVPIVLVAAALLVAGAGYAWQGHPGLAGRPTGPRADEAAIDSGFTAERKLWIEQVGANAQTLDAADALILRGDSDYAIGIVRGALAHAPRSSVLWMGLGNALVRYADGMVTPPARDAFDRAAALAPGNPAPTYFLAFAYAQSGDLDTAEGLWRGLLASAPPDAPWRIRVAGKLMVLSRMRATADDRAG